MVPVDWLCTSIFIVLTLLSLMSQQCNSFKRFAEIAIWNFRGRGNILRSTKFVKSSLCGSRLLRSYSPFKASRHRSIKISRWQVFLRSFLKRCKYWLSWGLEIPGTYRNVEIHRNSAITSARLPSYSFSRRKKEQKKKWNLSFCIWVFLSPSLYNRFTMRNVGLFFF